MPDRQARIVADVIADVSADDTRHQTLKFSLVTDEYQLNVGIFLERRGSRTHNGLGTEVAAHRIQGEG